MKKTLLLALIAAVVAGCTSMEVNKIDAKKYSITQLCIDENPSVPIDDLLPYLVESIQARGIKAPIYHGRRPDHCEYSLWYTATQKRDFGYYMDRAVIRLRLNDETIASATYKHGGGLALNKWGSAEYKLKPVLDELFADFDPISKKQTPSDR